MELPENTSMNEYAIELIEGKQLPYGPIYALSPVELETLKTYIETTSRRVLFDFLSLLRGPPSFLIKNLMAASTCALIIKASTIL